MKVTKEQLALNREALVRAASRLIRERGFDGVGVADICKAAGLTTGALYAQFSSKEALAAEALAQTGRRSYAALIGSQSADRSDLTAYLDRLISTRARDNLAGGCPMTASASEIARKDVDMSASFTAGFEAMTNAIAEAIAGKFSEAERRKRALFIMAGQIGAIAVARGVAKANPELSDEIIAVAREMYGEIGGEQKQENQRH